ncbi:unnamed protein product, partial [Cuscuta epithymum]
MDYSVEQMAFISSYDMGELMAPQNMDSDSEPPATGDEAQPSRKGVGDGEEKHIPDADHEGDPDNTNVDDGTPDVHVEVGMLFAGKDEAYDHYKNYAKRIGFPIRIRSSTKDKQGNITPMLIECGRAGNRVSKSTNLLLPGATSAIGCKAGIKVMYDYAGSWVISKVHEQHNHPMSPTKTRAFRCNRRLTMSARRKIEINVVAGIPLHKTYTSAVVEAGGYENL